MEKLIANPLDLDYKYQYMTDTMNGYSVNREAADPTVILFNDYYLLFASMSGGFWYSTDLVSWDFKYTPELPKYDYAPDVRVVAKKVVFSASKHGEECSLFISPDPINEKFNESKKLFPFWDPNIFEDENGQVYLYWGCSNSEPLYGIELDKNDFSPIGEKVPLFGENKAKYGWERKGENNVIEEPKNEYERLVRQYVGTKPFIEGAFMNKHNGKYYLQYAAPGTECNVYADGVYVGEHPLGPFKYQEHNPFSSKPGGFITGAGHGSTFQDKYGNWWHASTMRISVNQNFERRVGLFKCNFDENGILYCNQNFADYPFEIPNSKIFNQIELNPKYNLLSYKCDVSTSSLEEGYPALNVVDENIRTWWASSSEDKNPHIELDLGNVKDVYAIQVNIADHKIAEPQINENDLFTTRTGSRYIFAEDNKLEYKIEISKDKLTWVEIAKEETKLPHKLIQLAGEEIKYIKLSNFQTPFGNTPAISGIRVFGISEGSKPDITKNISYHRTENKLNILLKWDKVEDADGYNIRYGIASDRMYNSWQVNDENKLNLSMINADSSYYIAIDSFNENGVTEGEIVYVE